MRSTLVPHTLLLLLLITTGARAMAASNPNSTPTQASAGISCPSWMNVDLPKLRSKETINLCELAFGKPLLIVNTASQCGFTPQFKGLEALHQQYKDQGLTIIGFPSDSFFQEHKDNEATAEVCYVNYGVSFTMVETSKVRGGNANSIFKHLAKELGGPRWNFNKYLISTDGTPVKHFGATVKPLSVAITSAIDAELSKH